MQLQIIGITCVLLYMTCQLSSAVPHLKLSLTPLLDDTSKALLPLVNDHFSECSLVLSHDYKVLPMAFTTLLRNATSTKMIVSLMFQQFQQVEILPAKQQSKHENIRLVMTSDRNLEDIMFLSINMCPLQQNLDHFIFWDRKCGPTSQFFFAPTVQGLKFKIGLQLDRGRPIFTTRCLYCPKESSVVQPCTSSDCSNPFPDFTWDFCGHTLRFPYFSNMSMDVMTEQHTKGTAEDMLFELVHHLGQALNFRWQIDLCSSCKPDGSFANMARNGIMEDLLFGKGDCAIGIAYTNDRVGVLDFTVPFKSGYLTFVTSQPKCCYSWMILIKPFGQNVWLLLGTAICLYMVLLNALLRRGNTQNCNALDKSVMTVLRSLLEQDYLIPRFKRNKMFRLSTSIWCLLMIVLCNAYKSRMLGLLMFPPKETLPSSFEELAASDLKVGIVSVSWPLLKTTIGSNRQLKNDLHSKMFIFPNWESCYKAALSTGIACITDTNLFSERKSQFVDRYGRKLLKAQQVSSFPMWGGLAAKKGAPFISTFEHVILHLQQGGFFTHWNSKFSDGIAVMGRKAAAMRDEREASGCEEGKEMPLSLFKVSVPFFILVLGWSVSCATFAILLVVHKLQYYFAVKCDAENHLSKHYH